MALVIITLMDDDDDSVKIGTVFDPKLMKEEPTPAVLVAARMLVTVTDVKADEPLIQLLK
jgi:hypothetical protein